MSKTGNNTGKKFTVDSLQFTVQEKEGKRFNAEGAEKAEGREEVEELKVEESKKERKTEANSGVKPAGAGRPLLPAPAFEDSKHHIKIYQGDCLSILAQIPEATVDLVFADPPYFLSNGGITCHAGRMVSVNKGEWDKSRGPNGNHEFNLQWLAACQRVLKPNGSIWVSGTAHVIHSVGFAMQQLGFKQLNDISWVKPNPPPNLSCRYFTHATETRPSSFLLIRFPILWIDPVSAKSRPPQKAAATREHSPSECPASSNSSSKSAASISSVAPTAGSSSPCSPTPSMKPAKNSVPPATPTPKPSSSSKRRLAST